MSYSLLLNTTTKKIYLGIIKNRNQVIDLFSRETNQNMIEYIIDDLNSLLIKNNINKNNIKKIYWIYGPGLFTGMRIGSLIIKAWNSFNNIKVFGIDYLSFQATNNCLSLIDAKGNKYFLKIFRNNKVIKSQNLIDENELNILKTKYNELIIIKDKEILIDDIINKIHYFKKLKMKNFNLSYLKKPC